MKLKSRLFLGTAAYPNEGILRNAVHASGCELVTVSIRRVSLEGHGANTLDILSNYPLLPNTAGCETARDAILTAELAREALETNWVKLEVIGDREPLYPDTSELLEATRKLVDMGFVVLSPIFATASNPGYGPTLGPCILQAATALGIPIIALGRIHSGLAKPVINEGVDGIAVMGGFIMTN